MKKRAELQRLLGELVTSQALAVLSTRDGNCPYGSLVAFAATDDLKHLLFATTRATRKYANLIAESHVALVIDNRSNSPSDFHAAVATTAVGTAEEVVDADRYELVNLYLARHPHLAGFVNSPTCAFFRVRVSTYYIVQRFQNVMELHIES